MINVGSSKKKFYGSFGLNLLVILLLALTTTGLAQTGDKTIYQDPGGLFSVPIPSNWTAEPAENYLSLKSPEGNITVRILVLSSANTQEAVRATWEIVEPGFDLAVQDIIDIPPAVFGTEGLDEFIAMSYEREDDGPIIQAEGRRLADSVFVLLFNAELTAAQQRAAQLQIIDSGFRISALEQTDLSTAAPLPLNDELLAEFEAYIGEKMSQLEVPGASIAIVQGGKLVYAKGFGVRNLDSQEAMTPETLLMIGSSTKSMTTMMMAQLVDEGVFAWDTPVINILPGFKVADPELSQSLNMKNLVCACTGVPRRDFEWLFNADELTAEAVIASLADFEFFTDFGEAFQYSNQMVASGGYIATLAAGGSYGQLYEDYLTLFEERILDPLGMKASTFSFAEAVASGNYATPYAALATGETVELPLTVEEVLIPMGPAGALWSNVLDMANYLITELNEGLTPSGERLVSAENLALTWEPQVAISADASYGLGWIIEDYKGLKVISHGGNTFGFSSELAFLPELDLGISILTNQRASALNQSLRYRLLELLYEQEPQFDEVLQLQLDLIEKSQSELREALITQIEAEELPTSLGTYANDALGEIRLYFENGKFILDTGEFQSEIRARADDEGNISYGTFTPPIAGMPLEFGEDENGRPIVTFGAGVVEYIFKKLE